MSILNASKVVTCTTDQGAAPVKHWHGLLAELDAGSETIGAGIRASVVEGLFLRGHRACAGMRNVAVEEPALGRDPRPAPRCPNFRLRSEGILTARAVSFLSGSERVWLGYNPSS